MDVADLRLERRYRRWLRWYPGWYLREHEDEILGVLLASCVEGSPRADPAECWNLVCGAVGMRLRPRIAHSHRSAWIALRLVWITAVMQFAVGVTVLATAGRLHAALIKSDPGYTTAQWHVELAETVHPLAIECGIGIVALVALAWAHGRARRWVRISACGGMVVLMLITTDSLVTGLRHGSAVDARADLLAGALLWLVESAALAATMRANAWPGPQGPGATPATHRWNSLLLVHRGR